MTDTVVFQTAFLGDAILTIPLLERIAARKGPVDVVATPTAAPLLETNPAVNRVILYDKRGVERGFGGLISLIAELRKSNYLTAYLAHRSIRSALAAALAGIPKRIGFDDTPGRWLYTDRVARSGFHECDRLLALASGNAPHMPRLVLTDQDRRLARDILAVVRITDRYIVLAPGSVWATKRWPHFGALAARLLGDYDVVAVGSAQDRGLISMAQDSARGDFADLAGRLPLRASAAVIEGAMAAVTNDSAPMHMAAAVGTPVIAIYGPTTPAMGFAPTSLHSETVELNELKCRPCSAHGSSRCPLSHHRCMRELGVDAVQQALARTIAGVKPAAERNCA